MNFYPLNIGDYAAATAHLTWVEDAAYRRLLDCYYGREEPIPLEPRAVYRLVRASSKQEREAVDTVLQEFFTKEATGWIQHRCEEEIAKVAEKKTKAKESANKRWGNMRPHDEEHANASNQDNANASVSGCEGNATQHNGRIATTSNGRNAPNPNPNPNPNPIKKNSGGSANVVGAVDKSKAKRIAPVTWWRSQEGIVAKAKELEIPLGSWTYDQLKDMCFAKIAEQKRGKAA